MDPPNVTRQGMSDFVMKRLGETLRGQYHLPTTLPERLYDLLMELNARGHPPKHARRAKTAENRPASSAR
jgi:hypothetical protein